MSPGGAAPLQLGGRNGSRGKHVTKPSEASHIVTIRIEPRQRTDSREARNAGEP